MPSAPRMDIAHRGTGLGTWRCLGQGATGLKGRARPLAPTIALSLGGKAFGQERNPQHIAKVYSSDGVAVGGNEVVPV